MIKIQKNVPLAPFTTFKIGGPAKFFCEIKDENGLVEAVKFARQKKLDTYILAGGSNVVVNDDGFEGLVILMSNKEFEVKDSQIKCGAGVKLSKIVNKAGENSLSGLEWAAGIPGTIGGAVRGNAGAYGGEIKDIIESVTVLVQDRLKIIDYGPEDCEFSYRSSVFKKDKNLIIVSAVLKFKKGEKETIGKKMEEVFGKRNEKLPCDSSAGSFFQNPIVSNPELISRFERDMGCVSRGGKIPAGWLIDEVGLRGKKMGGVMVSEKHANFVVNSGQGKAQDVVMLASFIKQQVRDKLGVELHEEVQYVGF